MARRKPHRFGELIIDLGVTEEEIISDLDPGRVEWWKRTPSDARKA